MEEKMASFEKSVDNISSHDNESETSIAEPFPSLKSWRVLGKDEEQKSVSTGIKQGSTFEHVVLVSALEEDESLYSHSTGRLLIGVNAVIWQGKAPTGNSSLIDILTRVSATAAEERVDADLEYCFRASDLSGEIVKIDSSVEAAKHSGLRIKLENDSWLELYFASDDYSRSRRSAQRCTTLLKCLIRTVIVRNAASFDGKCIEAEQSSSTPADNKNSLAKDDDVQDAIDDEIFSFKKKKKSKRRGRDKDRRKSLTLDALEPFLGLEEIKDEATCADTSETQLTKEPSNTTPEDIPSLIRNLVRLGPDSHESQAITEKIQDICKYDISLVRTPEKSSLKDSPPKKLPPSKSDLYKLKPIVVEMSKRSRYEKREIQEATKILIKSPKGHTKHFQYFDENTNEKLSPSVYERRYLKYIGVEPCKTFEKETVKDDEVYLEENTEDAARKKFSQQLQIAVSEMHKKFEDALSTFLSKKSTLEEALQIALIEQGKSNAEVSEILKRELAVMEQEPTEQIKPDKNNENLCIIDKKSKRNRRKSVCLDDIIPMVADEPLQDTTNKRVIWSARS